MDNLMRIMITRNNLQKGRILKEEVLEVMKEFEKEEYRIRTKTRNESGEERLIEFHRNESLKIRNGKKIDI